MRIFNKFIGNSEFKRNVLTVFSGTALSQLVSIIVTPVLAKWFYGPSDFGTFATFIAITSIFVSISSGKYENAIILPKDDSQAYNIMRLSLYVVLFLSILLFLFCAIFHRFTMKLLGDEQLNSWIYLVPVAVFIASYNQVVSLWYIRKKEYRNLSLNRISKSMTTAGSNIGIVSFFSCNGGLILGNILGNSLSSIIMYFRMKRYYLVYEKYSINKLIFLVKKYRNFPFFVVPSEFLSVVTAQIPIFILLKYFGSSVVGNFSFVMTLLGVPLTLLAGSILDVFKERATRNYREYGNCIDIYIKTLRHLLVFSIPLFVLFIILSPFAFKFAFGTKWEIAGYYSQILAIMFLFKFISSPLSYTFIIASRMREDFFWHLYIFASSTIGLLVGALYFESVIVALWVFSLNYSFIYLVYLFRSYSFAKGVVPIKS
jgi:O-antigen/teichoic acid export membrane protein